jgi:pimeloyl-ACP methyl ester carboxylesterase
MERKIIELNGIHIHYRKMGVGPTVILLHPSPLSSATFNPFIEILSTHFTVIAPDTPGYGYSDPLPQKPSSIQDYIPFIFSLANAFDPINKVTIYGTATGAQMAIAFATLHPEKVKHLFLDNAAHFTKEQRTEICNNYFIGVEPKEDGSHLLNIWNHIKNSTKYFPWYSTNEENQFSNAFASPKILQQIFINYTNAGENYADAYTCAFANEDVENVKKLSTPTTIFRWTHSPIIKYIDQLLAYTLPNNITIETIDKTNAERLDLMKEKMILSLTK